MINHYDKSRFELKLPKRKTPARHTVKSHTRKGGSVVKSHQRGRGTKSRRPSRTVGKTVQKGSVLGDLGMHELVMAKDRATTWWRPDVDTIVYWKRDWEMKNGKEIWVWDGPFVLKGYEKESMDGRRLGTFADVKGVERKIARFKY